MKTNKKYSVIVMAIAIIASLVLFGCPDDSSSNGGGTTGNAFNLANCYRIYGDDDCKEAATGLVSGEVIGTVEAATGATAFAITAGNTPANFAISNAGVLTAAKAVTTSATFSQELTITITGGADAGTKKITVNNAIATATIYEAPLGQLLKAVAPGATQTVSGVALDNRCSDSAKCINSAYTVGTSTDAAGNIVSWGGWYFDLASGNPSIDLSSYENIVIRYNAQVGITKFEFKMESMGVNDSGYQLDLTTAMTKGGVTRQIITTGSWQEVTIPLASLKGARESNRLASTDVQTPVDNTDGLDISKITVPLGFWNQGVGFTLRIDEVYAR